MITQVLGAAVEVLDTVPDDVAARTPVVPAADGGLDRPFTPLEGMLCDLDTTEFPWTVQIEARVAGRLDVDAVRSAVVAALVRHPMGFARRAPHGPPDAAYRWEEAAGLDVDPVVEVVATSDADHAALRDLVLSSRICVDVAPLVRAWVMHRPDGDSLVLAVSHVLADGLGALRLLRSVAAALAGRDDGVDPVSLDEALRWVGPTTLIDRAVSLGGFALANPVQRTPVSRIAVAAGDASTSGAGAQVDGAGSAAGGADDVAEGRSGFRLHELVVDAAGLSSRRHADATTNDLLVAALHLAIEDHNADHATETDRIGVMMPVNLRPAPWRDEVVVNLASMATVSTGVAERETPGSLLDAVARQTRRVKRTGSPRALDVVLAGGGPLPVGLKRFLPMLLPLTGDRLVDTAVLSNLGRTDPVDFGPEVGPAVELWFSPPARMPLGVGIGAATLDDRLHLSFRSCGAQFDDAAARGFVETYRRALEFLG
ncbi:MAG: hypothetical protein KDB36_12550 [Acidimicrobiales bacterium]|nr:hypothetical protein [Acidimicrobiales bacterium]